MELASSLQVACDLWPDRPAITFRGATMTFGELSARVGVVAGAYRAIGISPGDRVLCALTDRPEHIVAMNAAWACGAIHAGTDADLTASEMVWLVERTEAAALLIEERPGGPDVGSVVDAVRGTRPEIAVIVLGGRFPGAISYDDLCAGWSDPPAPAPPLFADADTALLLLTSGTTGKPKAVMESLPHCWAKMQFFADAFQPGPDDVHLVYLPIGHVFGLRLALIALLSGGRLVLLDRFSPNAALDLITTERVTVLPGMPTHLRLLVDGLDPRRHDVSSLRWVISAAANLARPLAEEVYGRLAPEVLFVFGCSEGFTTLTTDRDEILAGSVGSRVFCGPAGTAPDGTVAIVDPDDNRPLDAGDTGEIVFGARQSVRYWRDPDAATDGWYHTGDLGRMDNQARLYLVGRLKDLLNRGGLKVSPGEIETALARHPGLVDAAVVATPDPVLGEAICACIVPGPGAAPALADIRAYLGVTLARHKLPDELCLLDQIPRTDIGKVDRRALRALVVESERTRERLRPR